MAKPPEPIRELLPRASLIVEAEVAEVVSTGPEPPKVEAPPTHTSVPQEVASQVLRLKIKRVLKGALAGAAKKSQELTVTKPQGAYALSPGNRGPFLLEETGGDWLILGRWGPDNYRIEWVEKSIAAAP